MVRLLLTAFVPALAFGQFDPDGAHVNLYLPQLADGGPAAQRWQTSLVFYNPSANFVAECQLTFLNDAGGPLTLNFGNGLRSTESVTIPPLGRRTLRSLSASPTIVTGWARGGCNVPTQATVLFRSVENGVPRVELSAPAVVPTGLYRSPANRSIGIALANPYTASSLSIAVTANDSEGRAVGTRVFNLQPSSHTSFNLSQYPDSFPREFEGSVTISTNGPAVGVVAWMLNSDRGLLTSLPTGGTGWPGSYPDRLLLTYQRVLLAARRLFPDLGLVRLEIPSSQVINATASPDGTVRIFPALVELAGDSPSELASVIAHELGHIMQFRQGGRNVLFPATMSSELDADGMSLFLTLAAGYDPYAVAGMLGKLMMATQRTDLISQAFDNLVDPHTSFTNRMAVVFELMQLTCATPQAREFCSQYRNLIHPSFPPTLPLSRPGPTPTK